MIKDIDGLLEHVTICLQKRMDIAVVGMSGGADSTLVAILCANALGKENVYSLHMPYDIDDASTFNAKSIQIADRLGINKKTISIGKAVDFLSSEICHLSRLNMGNMKSRMRMIALYTMSGRLGEETGQAVRVVGTGNLSEDFIGYDTKGGDSLVDYSPIGSLVKSEVYQLLDYFRDQNIITDDMIDRVPSAGLWEGQTDEEELGYTYNEMESYVLDMYNHNQVNFNDPISKFVYDRWKTNRHKREVVPVVALRSFCE